MMVEKEQDMQEQKHVRMNLEMNHHHEKYDQVQCDQDQKLHVCTI